MVELSAEVPSCSNFMVICGDVGNFRSTGDLRRFWTLQIIDFEPLLQNYKGSCPLENLIEGSLDEGRGAVKIFW